MMQRQIQRVVLSSIALIACAPFWPAAARAQGSPARGAWNRSVRANGETWIYRFTVTEGARADQTVRPDGRSGGGDVRRVDEQSGGAAGSSGRARRLAAGPPSDDGGAADGSVDIVAQRAYLRTATGGQGNEVAAPAVGQTVYFHVDFGLAGATAAVDVSRRSVIDGQNFCSTTESTAAGSYFAWCTNGWTATAGDHTLRWDFDYDNTVAETDESNNSETWAWTSSSASVDLSANRAFLKTMAGGTGDEVTTPSVGQTVFFYVDLTVVGPDSGVMVDRQALIDGQPFCTFTSTLQPGDYFSWCTDGWPATAGSHTLRWDLDYNNAVTETDENNNSVSTTWPSGAQCAGDCDGNHMVTVNELITMVDIALGNGSASCSAGDANGDSAITITDIVAGVKRALNGCG